MHNTNVRPIIRMHFVPRTVDRQWIRIACSEKGLHAVGGTALGFHACIGDCVWQALGLTGLGGDIAPKESVSKLIVSTPSCKMATLEFDLEMTMFDATVSQVASPMRVRWTVPNPACDAPRVATFLKLSFGN